MSTIRTKLLTPLGALVRRDPAMCLVAFAVWMALSGVSLLWPGDIFVHAQPYSVLRKIPIPEEIWGSAMIADAAAIIAISMRDVAFTKVTIIVLSSVFWMVFGVLVVIGGYYARFFSAVGMWDMAMAAGLIWSTWQTGARGVKQ